MKKLFILTVLTVNLLVVSQYAKAYTYSTSHSGNPNWGGVSAWYGGNISQTFFKSTSNALYIEFNYSLEDPGESDYVWGVAVWSSLDPAFSDPFRVYLGKSAWDIDPSPRLDTCYDALSQQGNVYIEVYSSGSIYGSYNDISCYYSWW